MRAWGKTPVVASDTPGFIVNRVARPFYGESIRILEEGIADCATIDWAMRELGGFRMGPFELMDFIGNDVNYAVTRSVFEGMFYDPRYKPSLTQRRLVEAGRLRTQDAAADTTTTRAGAVAPEPTKDPPLGQRVFDRVLAMLINEAVDAVYLRVASPADIDLAMTKGRQLSEGLARLGRRIGRSSACSTRMERLQREYGEDRYRPSPLLRRMAREDGGSSHERDDPRRSRRSPSASSSAMMARDAFSRWLGIEVLEVRPRGATMRMTVRDDMLNGFGVCHGGAMFSLADSALAFACNTHGRVTVSIENSDHVSDGASTRATS